MADSITERGAFITAIILYLATLFSLTYLSDSNIFVVFIGTLPILLYLIVLFYFASIDSRMVVLWVLPLVFPLIFFLIWSMHVVPLLDDMQGGMVTVIDIVMSYIMNVFVLFVLSARPARPDKRVDVLKNRLEETSAQLHDAEEQLYEAKREVTISKENFNVNLRTIEDKCKAINFVIGRVYSKKKGASKAFREKIRIPSALYNSFSRLSNEFKPADAQTMADVLLQIEQRLKQFEMDERSLGLEGEKRIIDVLAEEDNDPVTDYYKEAREICTKLITFLNETYINSNTYFG